MPKGLLAQWRRRIVARGLAAAVLLAVPVGVAAAIGFGTSLSGLSEGLGALASGPARSQAEPDGDRDPLDSAISAVATATTGGRGGGQADAPGTGVPVGGGGGDGDSPSGGSTPDEPPFAPEASGGTSGTDEPGTAPEVDVPNSAPVTDPVGGLLDGLGGAVDGLLGRH
jgi:hypothetical protein